MSRNPDEPSGLLQQFQSLVSSISGVDGTGDLSLDLTLKAAGDRLGQLIQELAVPHWFDLESVRILAADGHFYDEPESLLSEVLRMPWVRPHPLGFVYHDEIRGKLRNALVRRRSERSRNICRLLRIHVDAQLAQTDHQDGGTDSNSSTRRAELRRERVYLTLAYSEPEGLVQLDEEFRWVRREKLFNAADDLIQMAREQAPLLSPSGATRIELYSALLAFDSRDWDGAIRMLSSLNMDLLPREWVNRALLHQGMALERIGRWSDARTFYLHRNLRARIGKPTHDPMTWAKIRQRVAEVYFALRDLKRAESEGLMSLKLNEKSGDRLGQAINLRFLGIIREKLHDTAEATALLTKSLSLFQELKLDGDVAKVYAALGAVWLNAAHWARAREAYENEQRIRATSGDSYGLAFVYANLGKLTVAESGDIEQALKYFKASEDIFREFRDPMPLANVLSNAAFVLEGLGRYSEALNKVSEACRLTPSSAMRSAFENRRKALQRLAANTSLPG